jgi:hypothetical protein
MTPSESSRVTVAELGRRLDHMEDANKTAFQGLHRRLDELNYVHPETFALQLQLEQAHREDLAIQLAELKAENAERKKEARDNRRMVWTALVFPIVTAIAAALIIGAIQ